MVPHPQAAINGVRFKTALKMAISKLKFIQDKKTVINKQLRRQLADLLNQGKESSARIRVENIIREDIYIELLEYLELYCELLLARLAMILDPARTSIDAGLKEAVYSVIYAAPFAELKELLTIGELLLIKYGVELHKQVNSNEEGIVPDKIVSRCKIEPPSSELTTLYLCEIAKAYKAPFSGLKDEETSDDENDGDGDGGGSKIPEPVANAKLEQAKGPSQALAPSTGAAKDGNKPQAKTDPSNSKLDDFDSLKARFAALKGGPK